MNTRPEPGQTRRVPGLVRAQSLQLTWYYQLIRAAKNNQIDQQKINRQLF